MEVKNGWKRAFQGLNFLFFNLSANLAITCAQQKCPKGLHCPCTQQNTFHHTSGPELVSFTSQSQSRKQKCGVLLCVTSIPTLAIPLASVKLQMGHGRIPLLQIQMKHSWMKHSASESASLSNNSQSSQGKAGSYSHIATLPLHQQDLEQLWELRQGTFQQEFPAPKEPPEKGQGVSIQSLIDHSNLP